VAGLIRAKSIYSHQEGKTPMFLVYMYVMLAYNYGNRHSQHLLNIYLAASIEYLPR